MVVSVSNQTSVQTKKVQPRQEVTNSVTFGDRKADKFQVRNNDENCNKPKLEVGKNLAKGVLRPFKELFTALKNEPVFTVFSVASIIATCKAIPLVGALVPVGLGGFGAYKIGSGAMGAIKHHKNGDEQKANESIKDIGEGTVDIALAYKPAKTGFDKIRNVASDVFGKGMKDANLHTKAYTMISLKNPETPLNTVGEVWNKLCDDATHNVTNIFSLKSKSKTPNSAVSDTRVGTDTSTPSVTPDPGLSVDLPDLPPSSSDKNQPNKPILNINSDKVKAIARIASSTNNPKVSAILFDIANNVTQDKQSAALKVASLAQNDPESLAIFANALKKTNNNKDKIQSVLNNFNVIFENNNTVKQFENS